MSQVHPIPMLLWCPKCHTQHVDEGEWATIRTHKTHLCAKCGHEWRPANVETVGVESLPDLKHKSRPKHKPASDYKIVDGTYYDKRSSDNVINVIERCRKTAQRIQVYHGYTDEYRPISDSSKKIGEDWLEESDVLGYVGRSMGPHKVPLLIEDRQPGGPELSCYTIVRIRDARTGADLYRHPQYRQPTLTMGPVKNGPAGQKVMAEAVYADGDLQAQFEKPGQAAKWARKFGWEIT